MSHRLRFFPYLIAATFVSCSPAPEMTILDLTADQQLVVAAFRLDTHRVEDLLSDGANPNATLGFYNAELFEDKWTLGGSHMGSARWTPLLAVASSHRAPQPWKRAENSKKGLDAALAKMRAIDAKIIAQRDERRVEIAKRLIAAGANLDADDGYGATALYRSIYLGYKDLSLLLIASNARIDTTTAVYIDGTGGISPMHRATKAPEVLAAVIKRGANVNVVDDFGDTPLHWAVSGGHVESAKLLIAAGARTIYEVPRPNSGTYSTEESAVLLPKAMQRSTGIGHMHKLLQEWHSSNSQSIRVHVHRDGKIRTTDFWNKEHLGIEAIQRSVDGVPRWGNPASVLLTSDTDGWNDLQQKRDVLDILFTPGIQIYVVVAGRRD